MLGWSSLVVVLAVTMRLSAVATDGAREETCGMLLSPAVLLLLFLLDKNVVYERKH
jgi:hypothetical protein